MGIVCDSKSKKQIRNKIAHVDIQTSYKSAGKTGDMTGAIQKFNLHFPVLFCTPDWLTHTYYLGQWFQSICPCNSSLHNCKLTFNWCPYCLFSLRATLKYLKLSYWEKNNNIILWHFYIIHLEIEFKFKASIFNLNQVFKYIKYKNVLTSTYKRL